VSCTLLIKMVRITVKLCIFFPQSLQRTVAPWILSPDLKLDPLLLIPTLTVTVVSIFFWTMSSRQGPSAKCPAVGPPLLSVTTTVLQRWLCPRASGHVYKYNRFLGAKGWGGQGVNMYSTIHKKNMLHQQGRVRVWREIPHKMSLKTDKAQERKWLASAKKQPKKGHGNIQTEAL
jgi:hypothetical protein